MTRMEELLRTAFRDDAAEVAPERVRPLQVERLGRSPRPAWSRRRAGLARQLDWWRPAFAAAAVVCVVALSLGLAQVLPAGHGHPGRRPASRPTATAGVPDTPPPYYAVAARATPVSSTGPELLSIRATATGRLLAAVAFPAPFGTAAFLAGTGNPGSWVVALQRWQPVKTPPGGQDNSAQPVTMFRLSYDKAARRAVLARLPVPAVPAQAFLGAALSADGSKLALLIQAAGGTFEVRVYPLHGGNVKTWPQPPRFAKEPVATLMLNWLGDNRTLAMESGSFTDVGVWFLDTAGPVGDLLSASRHVALVQPGSVPPGGQFLCGVVPVAAADGKTITCGGAVWRGGMGNPSATGIGVFSALTGRLITIRDKSTAPAGGPSTGGEPVVLWAGPSGGLLIGVDLDGRPRPEGRVAMLTQDGRVIGIPVPGALLPILTRVPFPIATIAW